MVTTLFYKHIMEVFLLCRKTNMERKNIGIYGTSDRYASGTDTSSGH